jgi:hypothetical protein
VLTAGVNVVMIAVAERLTLLTSNDDGVGTGDKLLVGDGVGDVGRSCNVPVEVGERVCVPRIGVIAGIVGIAVKVGIAVSEINDNGVVVFSNSAVRSD